MTDKEKLAALLREFGVEFEEAPESIECAYGHQKVGGYPGFITIFEFDAAGKFEKMGAWE